MRIIAGNQIALAFLSVVVVLGYSGCASKPKPATHTPAKPAVQTPAKTVVQTMAKPDPLQAGVAEIDITPPVGYRMAADVYPPISTGTHDPLKAKAIVLQESQHQVALVFCDLPGLPLNITRNARDQASRAAGIPVTNIVIAATGSRTGPLFNGLLRDFLHQSAVAKHGVDTQEKVDYAAFLTGQLVQVILKARSNLQPSEVDAGITTQAGLPFNGRYYLKDGSVVINPSKLETNVTGPAGPVDSDLDILLVKYAKHPEPVGGLTVFAMRADTVGGTEFSADYPYFIEQTLRKVYGRDYVSAFAAAPSCDLNHIDPSKPGPAGGEDTAEGLGQTLGTTVLADLSNLKLIDKPALCVRSKNLMLPLETVTPRQVSEAKVVFERVRDTHVDLHLKERAIKVLDLGRRGTNCAVEIQAISLDRDTVIVCLPAEVFAEFGLAIKKASPFKQTMVVSLCNDSPGCIETTKALKEAGCGGNESLLQAGGGEAMVESAIKMLNELKRNL